MNLIILDKFPTEYYLYRVFKDIDEKITLICFKSNLGGLTIVKHISMLLRYKGYELKDVREEDAILLDDGGKFKDVIIFELEMIKEMKEIKKQLDKTKEIKLIKMYELREPGRMLFFKKHVISKIKKQSLEPKEDYCDVTERALDFMAELEKIGFGYGEETIEKLKKYGKDNQ